MRDAKEHLGPLDLLDAPDVWEEASSRRPTPEVEVADAVRRGPQRILAAVVALGIFVGATVFIVRAFDAPVRPVDTSPSPSTPSPVETRGAWEPLPEPPIPFREGAIGFWVDGRVVIVGGDESAPSCPRLYSDCARPAGQAPRDGAAYDPSTETWTRVAESPMLIIPYSGGAVIGDTVYVWGTTYGYTEMSLLAYDLSDDRWTELGIPPGPHPPTSLTLIAAGDAVVAFANSQEHGFTPDLLFDPSTGRWHELPPDPLIPSFDRSMVWTGTELVLIGIEDVGRAPGYKPYVYRAAALDIATETWRRFPDSGIVGSTPDWFWSAGRVVNPTIGRVGNADPLRHPNGGMLDPATETWSDLPKALIGRHWYGGPSVGGDRYVVTEQGAILDVATGTWEPLPAPPIAADEQALAVWAGDRLIVWGGYRWDRPDEGAEMVDAGWSWIPSE
jgi:hypothetical protein